MESQPETPVAPTTTDTPATDAAPATPAPDAPTAAELGREKLAAIRERRAAQRARIEAAQATKTREEAESARINPARWAEDPVAAITEAKLDPRAALDALVKHVTEDDAPVTRAELRAREQKIADLEKRLAAQEAREEAAKAEASTKANAAAVAAQEERLMGLFEGEAHADFLAMWPREQILESANQLADHLAAKGQKFTLQTIAEMLLRNHEAHAARFRPSAIEPAPRKTVNGGRPIAAPRTLTTDLASETATRARKPETFIERVNRLKRKYG